jgi:uncharacterized tellurite resistance protein B-like protein
MRTYPNNSPQAAARIVAVATLADGHLCKPELDVLDRLRAHAQLGLQPEEFHCVVHAVCEDLLSAAQLTWADACRIDPATLAKLMAEIDDPLLRLTVLRLCVSVVEADGQVTDGESVMLMAAVEHWGLRGWILRATPADHVSHMPGDPHQEGWRPPQDLRTGNSPRQTALL